MYKPTPTCSSPECYQLRNGFKNNHWTNLYLKQCYRSMYAVNTANFLEAQDLISENDILILQGRCTVVKVFSSKNIFLDIFMPLNVMAASLLENNYCIQLTLGKLLCSS